MTILVTGSTGLVGSAVVASCTQAGRKVIGISSKDVNLMDKGATIEFIKKVKPETIISAAAQVGGIGLNKSKPVDVFEKNMQIELNTIDAARINNVRKYVLISSSSVYPADSRQPMKEEFFQGSGKLESNNSAYATVKIACMEYIEAHRKQYDFKWITVIANSLYGPKDNFTLNNSRVFAAMIRKFMESIETNQPDVRLWGSGKPTKDFLHTRDFSNGLLLCLDNYDGSEPINIGSGKEISLQELADKIKRISGFEGDIFWDIDQPEALTRKILDINKIKKLGWSPSVKLEDGIRETISWYKQNKSGINR
jgi:GDP-L-fucose synthase